MPKKLGYFDVSKVIVNIGGRALTGWAKGEFVSIEYNADHFTLMLGAGGDATRNSSQDMSAKIKIRLLHTAQEDNAYLSGLYALDRTVGFGSSPLGIGVTFGLTDSLNGEVFAATHCWITKPPNASYSSDEQVREWNLETHDLSMIRGVVNDSDVMKLRQRLGI